MKHFLSIIFFLVTLSVQSQTLKETYNWIKGKLEYDFYLAMDDHSYIYLNYKQKLSFDYNKKILTIQYLGLDKHKVYHKVVIPISKLNPDAFRITSTKYEARYLHKERVEFNLHFQCRDGGKNIKKYTNSGEYYDNEFILRMSNEQYNSYGSDFEKRITKALRHFVSLCGRKKEVF